MAAAAGSVEPGVKARRTIAPEDGAYPRRLRGARAPVLRVIGALDDRPRAVAIVGSRAASRGVLARAFALGRDAAAAGVAVVSGGAIGVDAAAHAGANAGGGGTVVVLGTGLDVLYPQRHRGLFAEVVARGGALVSSFPDDAPPRRAHFVQRNAVIAALADLVVVVGAEAASGSLHTARAAAGLGRRLAATPGTTGTDALLAAGAALVETGDDLLAALDGRTRAAARRALDPDEAAVVAALDPVRPRTAAHVAAAIGRGHLDTVALLGELELAGWVVPTAGGAYVCARVTACA